MISGLGATLRALSTPDRHGSPANILVGWKTSEPALPAGGEIAAFDNTLWEAVSTTQEAVKFAYLARDGGAGSTGHLTASIHYTIGDKSLTWHLTAQNHARAPVKLPNQAFFNLTGIPSSPVLDHTLWIAADHYLPIGAHRTPTSQLRPVGGSAYDFTAPKSIGENLAKNGLTSAHNYILRSSGKTSLASISQDPASGRIMELHTNQPSLRLHLASPQGLTNTAYCLEPRKLPISPNSSHSPTSILHPGETYSHEIIFRFPDPSSPTAHPPQR